MKRNPKKTVQHGLHHFSFDCRIDDRTVTIYADKEIFGVYRGSTPLLEVPRAEFDGMRITLFPLQGKLEMGIATAAVDTACTFGTSGTSGNMIGACS